jgi:hypothetical protein
MRTVNNTRLIKRRARVAQIFNVGGIAVLGIGLAISLLRPQYSIYTLVLLIIGVAASQYGIANAYRYSRKPRPDEELADALKGLDDRHRLYNYILPAYHVLLTPKQLYVLIARGVAGKIVCEGRKWHHDRRFSLGRVLRIFNPENLGNPVREAEWDREALEGWLQQHAEGLKVTVEPVVVFTSPQVDLDLRSPSVRPIKAKALKDALRKSDTAGLSGDDYRQLASAFDAAARAAGEGPDAPRKGGANEEDGGPTAAKTPSATARKAKGRK